MFASERFILSSKRLIVLSKRLILLSKRHDKVDGIRLASLLSITFKENWIPGVEREGWIDGWMDG